MDQRGTFVANWIAQVKKAVAAGSAARLEERHPDLVSAVDAKAIADRGFPGLAIDAGIRLDFLCQALAAGRPMLLADHLCWLKVALGTRGFGPEHIRAPMECLRAELLESLPPDHGELASHAIDDALRVFDAAPTDSESLLSDGQPHVDLARRYLLAVLEGRRNDAERLVLDALEAGASPDDLELHVLMRTQHEIGRMWQVGELHAAEEHFASRVAERLTTLLRSKLDRREQRGLRLVIASVGGNDHDLAARMLADRFEIAGWDPILLGANTPAIDLARAVLDFEADLVALSTALSLHVRATAEVCAAIRALPARANSPILVGGHPFQVVPDLHEVVGADATAATIGEALQVAEKLAATRQAS